MIQNTGFEQDWDAVAEYLSTIGHTLDRDFVIQQLSGGSANFNYMISMDGQKAVLRRPPPGPLPLGSNDVAREYKVLSKLNKAFPAAPKGLVFCDDERVIGVPFCISEFREGICIGLELPDKLKERPNIGDALSGLLVGTLADLHMVDVDKVGLSDLGKYDGFIERQVGGWFKRGGHVLTGKQMTLLEPIRDWLGAHLPQKTVGRLVHNDFKLDNMLIDPNDLGVSGVVDWDMCTIGDPFFELAIMLAYWGQPNDPEIYRYQARMPCQSEGWWSRQQVIERYFAKTGQSVSQQDMCFYWWLMQYRQVVVYAQLHTLYKRTGNSGSLTHKEWHRVESYYDELLVFIAENIDTVPVFLQQ